MFEIFWHFVKPIFYILVHIIINNIYQKISFELKIIENLLTMLFFENKRWNLKLIGSTLTSWTVVTDKFS